MNLKYCLIEDPNQLLTNFLSSDVKRTEFPAWIRYKPIGRVAKFYVSSLDIEKYHLSEIYEMQDVSSFFV